MKLLAFETSTRMLSGSYHSTICLIFAVMSTALLLSAGAALAERAIVTGQGQVIGLAVSGEHEYLGIPYAAPPLGNSRWLPPQPPARFGGLFQATQFGNPCIQRLAGAGPVFGSEDCLYLNVYVPDGNPPAQGFPVMVWIHGGALVYGAGSDYDPTSLVENGAVIVVTINYRLGLLGFFAHPAIDSQSPPVGNYGLMDQQFALDWVRHNIPAFGGDRGRVTIFGESAGGQSVYANLASPTAAGLFSRAIAESGAYGEFQNYFDYIIPLEQGESAGTTLVPPGTTIAANVGCADQTASCLRGVSAATLIEQEPATIYPFVDGVILRQIPSVAFATGDFNRVPVITGGNHDEWRLFVAAQYDATGQPLVTSMDYQNATIALWGPFLGPILYNFFYALADYPSPGIALGASGTDAIFACPELNSVHLLSAYTPTYGYEFNDEDAYLVYDIFPSPPYPPITFPLGAAHFTEVPYLFEVLSTPSILTPYQKLLSDTMVGYWTQFAKSGNPNSKGAPFWPLYALSGQFESLAPIIGNELDSYFDFDHNCSMLWNTF
jgi:para-nitrobenzyl esterase